MIRKPEGYDQAAAMNGDIELVTPGGHICSIRAAKEEITPNGKRQIVIAFDLSQEDAQAGYYQRLYASRVQKDVNAKWPGVYRQNMDENSVPFFKGLITSIEKSNPGYTWNWDETTLKGKRFGGVFGRRQFMKNDGSLGWYTEIFSVRSADTVLDSPVPEDKLLNTQQTQQPYGGYAAPAQHSSGGIGATDLPF